MSKGSTRRPESITREEMDRAWRRTFEQMDPEPAKQPTPTTERRDD